MGASVSKTVPIAIESYRSISEKCFLIDRLIAANCDFIKGTDNCIRIGVNGYKGDDELNPLTNQGIRIGDSQIYKLKSFAEYNSGIDYKFENNVNLRLFKKDSGDLFYHLKTPEMDVTREIDPIVAKFYKKICMASDELDKLDGFFKSGNLDR